MLPGRTEASSQPIRCAVYARKSTEEGLDQPFNSLEAQRDSAQAYIASQQAQGWELLPDIYNDGGFTGANMERPALARLLRNIEEGRVDCVVVYKVDRLSRSLLDFARIIGAFEKHGVSFVSVTQQFNTSTPVGRLTLHILLSFAQFERETISERTRDNKSAARRKGKWTGGYVPLGYDLAPGKGLLVVNEQEAARVRSIFELFRATGSVRATIEELHGRGWTTKSWKTSDGKEHRGRPFTAGSLVRLLSNELYTGLVRHQGKLYRGEQVGIVKERLWRQATKILNNQPKVEPKERTNNNRALLKGLLQCGGCGKPMAATRTGKGKRRYRYYVCRTQQTNETGCAKRHLVAESIENSVLEHLRPLKRSGIRNLLQAVAARSKEAVSGKEAVNAIDDDTSRLRKLLHAVITAVIYHAATGDVTIQLRASKRGDHAT
jgi:site-specific DNA recombinase